ncbi:16S rRNA pseudouridine(516) synthase [Chitinivorax sp. B]|uniref:pseudouridine synthase n=1 Tax=Chitinivorax sp. B TaxID=2502235 RepID=UPI0010F48004|nr:16S rRNA pseudouridine(516) synthase [Chitinivorax sp. B]
MPLERILQSQGFGSRKSCRQRIAAGEVTVNGVACDNPQALFELEDLQFEIDSVAWTYQDQVYLMLHKPAGYECSRNPQHHPSVLGLLPAPVVARGVQCVGRLDEDTTGLLLLTDDGAWLHALTHPRRHVPKRYFARLRHELSDDMLMGLRQGVLLHGETELLAARDAARVDTNVLALTIEQGKYHQAKRMVAAVSNRVDQLHRDAIGCLQLGDLPEGQWRFLSNVERDLAQQDPAIATG